MDIIRVISKPSFNITLLLVAIATVAFVGFSFPYLVLLDSQGQLIEGLGLFLSGLSVLTPIGFGVYEIQKAALAQSERKGDEVTIQIIQNNLIQTLNRQEETLRRENRLGPHEHLNASRFKPEEIRKMIPTIMEDRADIILSKYSRIIREINFRRAIASHFKENEKNLKSIVKESSDKVLDRLSEDRLEALGLREKAQRSPFYDDIYKYLAGWLKNSIEYGFPMPEDRIVQNSLDRKLYIDTLIYIRDYKMENFNLTEKSENIIVGRYLDILITRLEKS